MQKADTLDRLLILAALLFFGLVCILIIKRRIIDRGIRAATLFSRIAGVGSKPVQQKIVPSALQSTISQTQGLKKAVTTISNVLQEATSTVASVTSAVIASASLASASIASSASAAQQPPHSPASSSLSTDLELASSDVEATQTTIAVSESPGVDAQERALDEALFVRVQAKQGEDHQAEARAAVEGTESTLPLTAELEGISAQIEHIIDEL